MVNDVQDKEGLVVFPVAGPQTQQILDAIKEKDKDESKMFVSGVDTDQVAQYTEDEQKYFMTSGMKDLELSTKIALAHTHEFADKVGQSDLEALGGTDDFMKNVTFFDGTDNKDTEITENLDTLKAAKSD
ncbi:hypothetical protein Zmor_008908 [Zophobas morio]|uniref:Uncharacterized protein n=1 Tax=Zophobas morio TaxID=2755281 RepID=A0AA38HHU5_9CUCU|nr:hypothetical protein Zmor_008908 [Zophobas morio]